MTVTKNSRLREFDADNGWRCSWCWSSFRYKPLRGRVCESHWRALCGFHYLPWETGRKKGSPGRWGREEVRHFLLRFGEFVCLAICVTKKHSLLNFIRRNGRMGVAYDNTLIMHCMLLWVCVSVCVCGCICVDSLLPADFVVAFACGSCHCSTPLFLSSSFSPSLPLCLSSGCLSRIRFHFCCALTLHDSFGFGVQFSLCL